MQHRKPLLMLLGLVLLIGSGAALTRYRDAGVGMTETAQAFLKTLDEKQRETATMDYDAQERVGWHFIPKKERKGLQLRDMNEIQRKAAHSLLRSCLSQVGYDKATTIMDLEKILHKLEGEGARFKRDHLRYYFTVFGKPATDEKWGLSIEGHHLSLNFVVEGGKIDSHTPAFFGANPGLVMADYGVGPKKGTRVLGKEELLAFELLHSLKGEQRQAAVLTDKAPADLRDAGKPQPPTAKPAGIAVAKLNKEQVATLEALLESYAENMPQHIAQRRLSEIQEAGIQKVYFAWEGADKPGIGHYYRIEGPTFQVEFCNTQPDGAGNPANHIHSMWRDTAGDFGVAVSE